MIRHAAGIFDGVTFIRNSAQEDMDSLQDIDASIRNNLLKETRDTKYRSEIIKNNILHCKGMIAKSVSEDTYIISAISTIQDLDRICNTLTKRLREWYGYYYPELGRRIADNEIFVRRMQELTKEEFMKENDELISMGPDISKNDLDAMMSFARQVNDLYVQREVIMKYLEAVMKKYCPNIEALAGSLIAAKLLEKAGSLRHLSMMPSSTIQLLGAEQALFRHLRNKRIRPPKHGLILSHPFVMDSRREDRGQRSRMFAAKISIASKVDYFKGEFIGDKLKDALEKR